MPLTFSTECLLEVVYVCTFFLMAISYSIRACAVYFKDHSPNDGHLDYQIFATIDTIIQ